MLLYLHMKRGHGRRLRRSNSTQSIFGMVHTDKRPHCGVERGCLMKHECFGRQGIHWGKSSSACSLGQPSSIIPRRPTLKESMADNTVHWHSFKRRRSVKIMPPVYFSQCPHFAKLELTAKQVLLIFSPLTKERPGR
jgi:hypothetical protein